jgi:uncharacterized membrane protein
MVTVSPSLALMQGLVSQTHGKRAGWIFVVMALALAGFGVYLGRFLRWNSWDALLSPVSLLADILSHFATPWRHLRSWGFTFVCFMFLLLNYLMCWSLTRLREVSCDTRP